MKHCECCQERLMEMRVERDYWRDQCLKFLIHTKTVDEKAKEATQGRGSGGR